VSTESGAEAAGGGADGRSPVDPLTLPAPWLGDALAALESARAADRMPHALLIQGAAGTGADAVAVRAAQLVLCARTGACGDCPSCRRVASRQHPDLITLGPSEESTQIRIDQIRGLCADLALTSHQGGYKVAIIDPADSLNRAAANALLKTLEEPAPRTLLVLVAAEPSRLPATLVSRCQRIRIRRPLRAESLAWLERRCGPGDWNAVLDVIGEAPIAAADLDPGAVGLLRTETQRALDAHGPRAAARVR
jgi:DNA polymerase-3 subunit delta'